MSLDYEVLISDPIPQSIKELVPNGDRRMFSPISSTLIYGSDDAVLVDPPLTVDQTAAIGDRIERSGKRLTHIFATHGHADHWFGAGPLSKRFPGARVVASAGTIAQMRVHADPDFRARFWDRLFPGQLPDSPVSAETVSGNRFQLEGHDLVIVEVGHSDTDDTSVLHVPDLGLVVAGDVIYNGVHQYLAESADGGLDAWLAAIDRVEQLGARHITAGHKDAGLDDDAGRAIAETRRYLLDARELLAVHASAEDFFHAMLERHPSRLNAGALWNGASTLYRRGGA
ncbi:MBL fold metallo-hydrolase [Kutzneria kofuensis]|uniref:Glyoxylase-like metal-dependent hydrolase (Beta-lactamase superfamily II) n=1 Tax=Kutzneria kofuensis TaxID=103725 RepID=A0A7W9NJN0_9PSEU|nr:MBL fold metallo-hydrolase [Kutzneria kofuensis]MBB5894849.1 glyoxylase-like metal-dependent hydrolase (beta-lactamase superfamily II) [Kutzneria kofuensis]